MSARIVYHRFPNGFHCTEQGCRSRKYYDEDGKRFCQRGHEQAVRFHGHGIFCPALSDDACRTSCKHTLMKAKIL